MVHKSLKICDVPQEKRATYLRKFAGNSHKIPATFPAKFPDLTTRNFPDPATCIS